MPIRRRFYDPFVQATPVEQPPQVVSAPPLEVAGMVIATAGVYLLLDDVVAVLNEVADMTLDIDQKEGRAALMQAIATFEQLRS